MNKQIEEYPQIAKDQDSELLYRYGLFRIPNYNCFFNSQQGNSCILEQAGFIYESVIDLFNIIHTVCPHLRFGSYDNWERIMYSIKPIADNPLIYQFLIEYIGIDLVHSLNEQTMIINEKASQILFEDIEKIDQWELFMNFDEQLLIDGNIIEANIGFRNAKIIKYLINEVEKVHPGRSKDYIFDKQNIYNEQGEFMVHSKCLFKLFEPKIYQESNKINSKMTESFFIQLVKESK
eukprot:403349930